MERILGIDFGERRIGLALSDPLGKIASPFLTFDTRADGDFFQRIEQLIEKEGVNQIVLGMPRNMDGSIGQKGKDVLDFSKKLSLRIKIPITFWDERLSSVESKRVLREAGARLHKHKQKIDMLSAALILQGFLDSQRAKKKEMPES
ncbi:MAG TPA: Holliday junction resolvase RuvX [Terriglobales bacterium]|nr:Holliday junction resolvase RuvX [Terriglobales bacterium]